MGTAVCIAAYLFPYLFMLGEWWRWLPSTFVLLIVGAAFHGSATARFFGLEMSFGAVSATVVLCVVLLPVFGYVLFGFLNDPPFHVQAHNYGLKHVGQLFQVFNDEILLRAAAMTVLLRWLPYPKTVSLALAGMFAMGHHLLYRLHGSNIGWEAMATLFSFGAIANLLFVRFRHIGYSLAPHYAWNFHRFNSAYFLGGYAVPQGETFNHVEGNGWIAIMSFATFLLISTAFSGGQHSGTLAHSD